MTRGLLEICSVIDTLFFSYFTEVLYSGFYKILIKKLVCLKILKKKKIIIIIIIIISIITSETENNKYGGIYGVSRRRFFQGIE